MEAWKTFPRIISLALKMGGAILAYIWLVGVATNIVILDKAGYQFAALSADLQSCIATGVIWLEILLSPHIYPTIVIALYGLGFVSFIYLTFVFIDGRYRRFLKRVATKFIEFILDPFGNVQSQLILRWLERSKRISIIGTFIERYVNYFLMATGIVFLIISPIIIAKSQQDDAIARADRIISSKDETRAVHLCIKGHDFKAVPLVGDTETTMYRMPQHGYLLVHNGDVLVVKRPYATC